MISLRYFEKVKILFNVSTPSEYKTKMSAIKDANQNNNGVGYTSSFERVVPIYDLIDLDKVGLR